MADYIPKPNDTLGRYQLLTTVARGGMGQVWLGRLQGARGFHKLVAIKTLLAQTDESGRFEQMMLEEARIASLIHHPNVVQTIELGEQGGTLFLVMEWVDGEPLGSIFARAKERGGMPLRIACSLIAQTLCGLHAAHELCDQTGAPLGVVHRDVSPHNVLVTYSGVAKLVDFGIAKATNQQLSNTVAGEVKGKLAHMSPEQVMNADDVDRRSDLFSIGIMLYTLTTGVHPFKNANSPGVLHSIVSSEPVLPPSSFVKGYPKKLEAVLLKALEKDPARRFQTAEEMRLALERALPEQSREATEAELSQFLTKVLGDSAVAKREKLRAVLQAADNGRVPTGSGPAVEGARAESGSSLRAISLDSDSDAETPKELPAARRPAAAQGEEVVRLSLVPRSFKAKHVGIGLALGIALTAALFFGSRGFLKPTQTGSATGGLVELPRNQSPAATATAPARAPEPAPSATAPLPPVEVASAAPAATQIKPARVRKAPARKKAKAGSDDLIAPDYAR